MKQYSMTKVRDELSAVLRNLNDRQPISLTRYGKPVAVLMSISTYHRVARPRPSFWDAYQAFLRSYPLEQLGIEADFFDGLREASPGREVNF